MMFQIELLVLAIFATACCVDVGNEVKESDWMSAHCSLQLKDGTHVCGCTVISDQWLLTSAMCSGMYLMDEVQVALGSIDLEAPKLIKNVEKLIYHEDYHYDKITMLNDIGLIKLDSKVKFDFDVKPWPTLAENDGHEWYWKECKMVGWGMLPDSEKCTEHQMCIDRKVSRKSCDGDGWYQYNCKKTCMAYNSECRDIKSNILREASTTILTNVACTLTYDREIITKNVLCAFDRNNKKATAVKLDAGGPLFCKRDDTWYQVGIFNYREMYPDPSKSQIFTMVPHYTEWIKSNTGLNL